MKSWTIKSQNGRYGVSVSGVDAAAMPARKGASVVVQGRVRSLGAAAGIQSFAVEPDDTARSWVLIERSQLRAGRGADLVISTDLQSDGDVSIVLLSATALVEWHGYKSRSREWRVYRDGERQTVSPAALLAADLVPSEREPEGSILPPAPADRQAVNAALAECLS